MLEGASFPCTAKTALNTILPTIKRYDHKALLKHILSQHGIDDQGASAHWEFFFDLSNRRAQAVCEWKLSWDEKADAYGPPRMMIAINPFPPENSPLRRMVREGHLLHRQLAGTWLEEVRRHPALPVHFRDTDIVLADFKKQGLDAGLMEFSLSTDASPDLGVRWAAHTRSRTYFVPFS
ncbi:MAG: hypothetical protein FJZ87_02775 [Chloroflexi bacterium]|nr:hypothetical protein [Chloroflexota bacterium]